MERKINLLGIAGGIAALILAAVSLFVPWWQLSIANGLAKLNVSPLNINVSLPGYSGITVPLIWAINMACALSLIASGIIMLIYATSPLKPYAKRLLGFAYKTPLVLVLVFTVLLFALTLVAQKAVGLNIPLMGSANLQVPQTLTSQNAIISVAVSATFLWTYWFAVVTAGLCVAARIYHRKIAPATPKQIKLPPPSATQPSPPSAQPAQSATPPAPAALSGNKFTFCPTCGEKLHNL
ncbi:MAG: hypothetical protein ABSB10_00820 [Candidatus Bathyarchaeia archaeon]|jgi:hypothetical protein